MKCTEWSFFSLQLSPELFLRPQKSHRDAKTLKILQKISPLLLRIKTESEAICVTRKAEIKKLHPDS